MNKTIIEARKTLSRIKRESEKLAKRDKCMWCGKPTSRFCNSHTVPQFVLKNIDTEGKLDYFNSFMRIPIVNEDKGIGEAVTFGLLCRECDSKIFQEYENPENIKQTPSQEMLCEIALKNMLMWLSKRIWELEYFEKLRQEFSAPYDYDQKQAVNRLDERDFLWDFYRIKEMIEGNSQCKEFKLISWDKVDYRIPVAFQGAFSVYGDLNGDVVVDVYDKSEDVVNHHIHMCTYPLDDCSVIMTFYHEDDHEYDAFAGQIEKMEPQTRLLFLGYLLFDTSEDMLIAKKFPHRTYFFRKVQEMFGDTSELWVVSPAEADYKKRRFLDKYRNWKPDSFPGILTEKYAVRME